MIKMAENFVIGIKLLFNIIEPKIDTIEQIIGAEYSVLYCHVSRLSPQSYNKIREVYLSTISAIFSKYNKDVVFVYYEVEDHIEVAQHLGVQFRYAIGLYNPRQEESVHMDNFQQLTDGQIANFQAMIEDLLSEREVLSDEELDNSEVPLNDYYPRYAAKQKRDEFDRFNYDIEFASNLLEDLKTIYNRNVELQEKIMRLAKEMRAHQREVIRLDTASN